MATQIVANVVHSPQFSPQKVTVHFKAAVIVLFFATIKKSEPQTVTDRQAWLSREFNRFLWKHAVFFCWQTSGCRWRSCTMERQCWKQRPRALRGASSCRAESPSPTNGSMGPAAASRSASPCRRPYRYRNSWQTQWTDFSVIWRRGFCCGWPQMGCSLRGSAEAECTGVDPWPRALAIPTSWSEKRPLSCSIFPCFSMVKLCTRSLRHATNDPCALTNCRMFKFDHLCADLEKCLSGNGAKPSYMTELCFGEEFPDPAIPKTTKLIVAQVNGTFLSATLKRQWIKQGFNSH